MSNRKDKIPPKTSAKRGKLDPNRFQQEQSTTADDGLGMFAFDPIRREVFLWGLGTGVIGGLLTLTMSNAFFVQVLIVLGVAIVCNYQVAKASLKIPRTHATMMAMLGLVAAIFVGTFINVLIFASLN